MKLENLKQSSLCTSLMGVLRGVLDHYDIKIGDAKAFGGSGHAFLINIHEVVCPSGPYVWKYDKFFELLKNMGVEITDLGFFHKGSTADERGKIEQTVRRHLDAGSPCSVMNMDNQLINGYDDKGFFLTQPWDPKCDVTPPKLTFGTWAEFGDEIHACFMVFKKVLEKDNVTIIRESLQYAVDLFKNPSQYSFEKYKIGSGAYDNWIKALEGGTAHEHGNWWNAMVWSECRKMASGYFDEIAEKYDNKISALAKELSAQYRELAELLKRISDKEMKVAEKIPLVKQAMMKDETAVQKIEEFIRIFEKE
jgi:hypothetical protein